MMRSTAMRSSARRTSGPQVTKRSTSLRAGGWLPVLGTMPPVGLWPNTPLKKAGMRIEPPTSEPSPIGEAPAPTIAPSPPELPPAVRARSYGLLVRPHTLFELSNHMQSSEVFVTPSGIAPAERSRSTTVASLLATTSRRAHSPDEFGMPSNAKASLMVHGTPWSGGRSSACRSPVRSSASEASRSAAS